LARSQAAAFCDWLDRVLLGPHPRDYCNPKAESRGPSALDNPL
jgi:hypothetical protein